MITVEELVIASSRHKVTLINVKRAGGPTPTGGMMDGLGLLITGAQRLRAAMAAQNRLGTDEPSTSSPGRGNQADDNVPSTSQEVQRISSPGHMSPTSPMKTILDTGEFQLVKQLAKSMDVEVLDDGGLPPVWLFNPIPVSTPPRSPSSPATSPSQEMACRMGGELMTRPQLQAPARVDLSRYDHFSIVHYQDLTDPNMKSMVMIQTPRNQPFQQGEIESSDIREYLGYQPRGMLQEAGADVSHETSLVPRSVYPENMEVESQLIAMDEGHRPDDVVSILTRAMPVAQDNEMDSGIFDMVQGRHSQSSTLEGDNSLENSMATCGTTEAGYIASASTSPEPYIPDTEPMLSYKVYQINHEIVLSSSGDEGQLPRIETVAEKKALPLSSKMQQQPPRRKPKRTSSTRGRARGKRKTKGRGRNRKAASRASEIDDSRSGYTSTPETGASSPFDHSPVADKIDLATSMLEGASLHNQDLASSFTEQFLPPPQNAWQTAAAPNRHSAPPYESYRPQPRQDRSPRDGYHPGHCYPETYTQDRNHQQERYPPDRRQPPRHPQDRVPNDRQQRDYYNRETSTPEHHSDGQRYDRYPQDRSPREQYVQDQYRGMGRVPHDFHSPSRRSSSQSCHSPAPFGAYPNEQNGYLDSSDDYSVHNTSRIETTFSEVDDTVTCGEDETAFQPPDTLFSSFVSKVVPKPLQKPLRSGVNQGLNLFNRDRKSSAPRPTSIPGGSKNILNRYAMNNDTEDELATPSSTDLILSPSSDDSNYTMHTAYSQASWDNAFVNRRSSTPQAPREPERENPTGAPKTKLTEPRGPLMSSYRGPFLSVPINKSDASGDSDDPSEYESAEDRSLSPVSPAPQEMPVFVSHANWMSELPKRLHTVPLSGLAIPGSNIALAIEHDMRVDMSFSKCNLEMAEFLRKLPPLAVFDNFRHLMKDIWRSWMAKQLLSITQQLDAGVRYLDLRLTKYRGALYGEHGLFTRQLKQYMREVDEFLVAHPKEVIILHFQSFENVDHRDKRALVTTLFQIFGAKLSRTGQINKLTLEMLWKARKQLVIIFPDTDIEDLKNHIFSGLLWSNKIVRCSLPKKTKAMDLARYLDCIYDENRDEEMLHVIQAVLSPDMRMVFGDYRYKSMRELTIMETNPIIKHWMLDKRNLNIVAIDFVGCYDVTGGIIALNELKKAETFV